ncbi:MAG: GFA family protein [Hyphomicrobiaceae bacterium]
MTTTTGRCLCGEVTYSFTGQPSGVDYCHCDSCRRNCSAPVTAFVEVPRENFSFTGETPKIYESSPGIRRLFCGNCGAPVAYDADWDKTDIHLYLAAFDDPEAFAPAAHVFAGEQLSWFETSDRLPRYEGSMIGNEPVRSEPRRIETTTKRIQWPGQG